MHQTVILWGPTPCPGRCPGVMSPISLWDPELPALFQVSRLSTVPQKPSHPPPVLIFPQSWTRNHCWTEFKSVIDFCFLPCKTLSWMSMKEHAYLLGWGSGGRRGWWAEWSLRRHTKDNLSMKQLATVFIFQGGVQYLPMKKGWSSTRFLVFLFVCVYHPEILLPGVTSFIWTVHQG